MRDLVTAWSLWRRHSPYMLLRAFCFTVAKRGCLGAEAHGDPMRNPMRDPGCRSGSVGPWAIQCESRDERKLPCKAKSLPDGCVLEGRAGYLSELLNLADTRNDICIPVAIFNHGHEIF